MYELFVASELVRRRVGEAVDPSLLKASKPAREPRRRAVRASSAAALRSLADRLEPSPST